MVEILLLLLCYIGITCIYYLRRLGKVILYSVKQDNGKFDENGRKHLWQETQEEIDELK